MTYKQILVPDIKNHSVEIPEAFFGKNVKVMIVEVIGQGEDTHRPLPPSGKKVSGKQLLRHFGTAHDFPTQEEIRAKAWPLKW